MCINVCEHLWFLTLIMSKQIFFHKQEAAVTKKGYLKNAQNIKEPRKTAKS